MRVDMTGKGHFAGFLVLESHTQLNHYYDGVLSAVSEVDFEQFKSNQKTEHQAQMDAGSESLPDQSDPEQYAYDEIMALIRDFEASSGPKQKLSAADGAVMRANTKIPLMDSGIFY